MVVSGPYRVFARKSDGIAGDVVSVRISHYRVFDRWLDIDVGREAFAHFVSKHHFGLPASGYGKAEHPVLVSPDKQVALARIERRMTLTVRKIACDSVELRIVVYLVFHPCTPDRPAAGIEHRDMVLPRRHIAAYDIDFGKAGLSADDILFAAIVPEYAGMQQHCPGNRGIEPGHIESRLRLAGAHKPPFSVGPDLNPRVVVVGVGPSWGIDLPCRNARSP